jgi:HK97 family phage prohead protease
MALLTQPERDALPDSDFAHVEEGDKDESGRTVPRSKRHFPIHDSDHVKDALARIGAGAEHGEEALPNVKAAAKKFGMNMDENAHRSDESDAEVTETELPEPSLLELGIVIERSKLSAKDRNDLPDNAFAYIEPGGTKDSEGKTMPRSKRHFPVHDAAHARNALARIAQGAEFGQQALPKVKAAAKRFGIDAEANHDRALELYDGEISEKLEEPEKRESPDLFIFPERRYLASAVELRMMEADGAKIPHIDGYAAQFNKTSRHLGEFHERVMPTAFDEGERAGWPNVVCRYNHKDDFLLGTTGAGTLKISTDDTGLHYDATPPQCRNDVVELVSRGDVRYASFAFRCKPGEGDEWGVTDWGTPLRSLINVEPVDVAPVIDPAYFNTSANARNIEGALISLAAHKNADVEEIRSMLKAGEGKKLFTRTDQPKPKAPDMTAEHTETATTEAEVRDATEATEQAETEVTTEATEERSADDFKARMLWELNSKRYAPGVTE